MAHRRGSGGDGGDDQQGTIRRSSLLSRVGSIASMASARNGSPPPELARNRSGMGSSSRQGSSARMRTSRRHSYGDLGNSAVSNNGSNSGSGGGRIGALERARLEKEEKLAAMRAEIASLCREHMEDGYLHRIEVNRLKTERDYLEERVKAFERDLNDKDILHGYANLIREAASDETTGTSYVMRLQMQLAKAERKMGSMQAQLHQMKKSEEESIKSLQSEIAEVVRDKCRVELEFRDQLAALVEQKSKLETEYLSKIQSKSSQKTKGHDDTKKEDREGNDTHATR